jgi:hypothetical protein
VADAIVHQLNAKPSRTPLGEFYKVATENAPRERVVELVDAVTASVDRSVGNQDASVRITGAYWLAESGELRGARALVDRAEQIFATAGQRERRENVADAVAYVYARTGNMDKALAAAGDNVLAKHMAAKGAAQAGNAAAAKRVRDATPIASDDNTARSAAIETNVYLGDIDAARVLLDAIPAFSLAYNEKLYVKALHDARHPRRRELTSEAANKISSLIVDAPTPRGEMGFELLTLVEISKYMHDDGDSDGARRIREFVRVRITDSTRDSTAPYVKLWLVGVAEQANARSEVDALISELSGEMSAGARMHSALHREDIKKALELLSSIADPHGSSLVVMWSALLKKPRDPALLAQARSVLCR